MGEQEQGDRDDRLAEYRVALLFAATVALVMACVAALGHKSVGFAGTLLLAAVLLLGPLAVFVIDAGHFLVLGVGMRACAAMLWLGAVALFHRNQLTLNPAMPFLGLWLLSQVVASGPADRGVMQVLWIVTALAYGYSGLTKLLSPTWSAGDAIPIILHGPLGRAAAGDMLAAFPGWVGHALTFAALAVELAYVPFAFLPRARPWLWVATMLLHAGLVLSVDIADISIGMLVFHVALFDRRWLDSWSSVQPRAIERASSYATGHA